MMKKLIAAAVLASVGAAAHAGTLLSQGFDNLGSLPGWTQTNNSQPLGVSGWFQGNTAAFTSQSGAPDSYIGANFLNADNGLSGAISNWLITPTMNLDAGSVLSFFARVAGGGFLDTIEVRLSTNGASSNVGATANSVGDFTTLLGTYSSSTDNGWVAQTFNLASALGPGLTSGRIAFRYLVADVSVDGNYIGIDTVQVVPEPASLALVALAVAGLAVSRRRS